MSIVWVSRAGSSSYYYTTETARGRVRITRVNKHGVPAFRVHYPDVKESKSSTIAEAKSVAEARIATGVLS